MDECLSGLADLDGWLNEDISVPGDEGGIYRGKSPLWPDALAIFASILSSIPCFNASLNDFEFYFVALI